MLEFVLLCVYGKLFIFTLQKFPLIRRIKHPFWAELFSCQFCLGVWICSGLSVLLQVVLFRSVVYFPLVSELFTGVTASLVLWLLTTGFWEWFGRIEVN